MKRWLLAGAALMATCGVLGLSPAEAQKLDPRRPSLFVVGAAGGACPMHRVDARRTGASRDPLPAGTLKVGWRKTIGLSIDQPALVGTDGSLAVVTTRGDVVYLDDAGEERAHVTVGAGSVGAATMTSDGTIVFTSSTGDAIGVKRSLTRPRFVTRIGGERNVRSAPLPLDDGGVVVATMGELVALDAEGLVRSRAFLPEPAAAPLLATADKIIAVSAAGTIYGWSIGREPVRLGSFGAPIDGGAAFVDATTLLAVIEGNHLVEVDITRGARRTRAIAGQGLYLGPPAVRPGGVAALLAVTSTRGFVVTVDPGGQEGLRAPVASFVATALPDGGAAPLVAPLHTGPLVDGRGTIAFAATDGRLGVITPEGVVELIGEALCARTGRSAGVAGLTPWGPKAFAVTCDGGAVARISSAN